MGLGLPLPDAFSRRVSGFWSWAACGGRPRQPASPSRQFVADTAAATLLFVVTALLLLTLIDSSEQSEATNHSSRRRSFASTAVKCRPLQPVATVVAAGLTAARRRPFWLTTRRGKGGGRSRRQLDAAHY